MGAFTIFDGADPLVQGCWKLAAIASCLESEPSEAYARIGG